MITFIIIITLFFQSCTSLLDIYSELMSSNSSSEIYSTSSYYNFSSTSSDSILSIDTNIPLVYINNLKNFDFIGTNYSFNLIITDNVGVDYILFLVNNINTNKIFLNSVTITNLSIRITGLNELTNIFKYFAVDINSNNSEIKSITNIVDGSPPYLYIISPSHHKIVYEDFLLIITNNDTISGIENLEFRINNIFYQSIVSPSSFLSQKIIISELDNGTNLIELIAIDKLSNISSKTIEIIKDLYIPIIVATNIENILITNKNIIDLYGIFTIGEFDSVSEISMSINNESYNNINYNITDKIWNKNEIELLTNITNIIITRIITLSSKTNCWTNSVIVDKESPTIKIINFENNQYFNTTFIEIIGFANDNLSDVKEVYLKVNNDSFNKVNGTTNWNTNVSELSEGTNVINFYALDIFNNYSITNYLNIIIDITKPTILITNITDNQVFYTNYIEIIGIANDNLSGIKEVYLKINNDNFNKVIGTTYWYSNVFLSNEGTNIISIYSVDNIGNSSDTQLIQLINYNPPSIFINSPTNYQKIPKYFTLIGEAYDDSGIQLIMIDPGAGEFIPASGTTNWLINITNTHPGTNNIRAFAIDLFNNTSITQSIYLINPIFIDIACGGSHSLALENDGDLWGTGYNTYGQLGKGNSIDTNIWTFVLNNVTKIAGGSSHSLALKKDNSLWATGYNYFGQLGNGDYTFTNIWLSVFNDVKEISCGYYHSIVIKNDNSLWGTGYNQYGQLGLGDNYNKYIWNFCIDNVKQVACGGYHSLILKNDGSLWATGRNNYGQLGKGDNIDTNNWVQVLDNVDKIACGNYHSFALKNDGSLWGVGYNYFGQLGNGNNINTNIWVLVLSNVKNISCGSYHSFAIKNDDTLWGTGRNEGGQLGNGTCENTNNWILILSNIYKISCGNRHSLALTSNYILLAAGTNFLGQLGNGNNTSMDTWTEVNY